MKMFWLKRTTDISGSSGIGIVAEGIVFSNGKCCLSWLTAMSSIAIYNNITELEAIHGHSGATEIIWNKDE